MEIKKFIYEKIKSNPELVENFFLERYKQTKPLFYSSVDIRYSGYKIAPVDTNLFPAGFNLLTPNQQEKASEQVIDYINNYYPNRKKILLIPENHTRNKYYLLNVFRLSEILKNAGLEVVIGGLTLQEKLSEQTITGEFLEINPIFKQNNKILVENFIPEIVIVNNDFSAGNPEILSNLDNQPIIPPVSLGWFKRRKSQHFETYDLISREFSRLLNFDNWYISSFFKKCGQINFKQKEGLEAVATYTDEILQKTAKKYKEYGIEQKPYAFIKANSGTYGMGIMVVQSANDVLEINKKARHSMNTIKEGQENSEVVIQEGIITVEEYQNKPAEPMVYLVNSQPVGCTYRINNNQDKFGNLNSSGMEFVSFDKIESENNINCPVQGVIARLASLAASRECYEENWDI
jgi:glutamate--cysteine ligase